MKNIQVAIDGPAGAGKSSVSKNVAKILGFVYIDTGAMYRTLAYSALKNNLNLNDVNGLVNLLSSLNISFEVDEKLGIQKVYCNDLNVTELIRTPEVTNSVSVIAAISEVRNLMVHRQRIIASENNVVMDGRDIGTVVLPKANYKFFLTASIEERVKRRALELKAKGYDVDIEKLTKEITDRDKMDSEREVSPLKPAEDSIILDTSALNLEQVINKIINYISEEDKNVL